MLEACELNSVSEEDYNDLGRAGLGSCLLGGLPDWLVGYAARLVCAFICLDTFFFFFVFVIVVHKFSLTYILWCR